MVTRKGRKKPIECPKCGSSEIVPIVYGYPLPETEEKARRGEIALGGCRIIGNGSDPKWACRKCGKKFGG
jgi:hypothetical protein